MPEYLHPGVYIEEIERGPRPIEGVPTSTSAFLGETERGTLTPTLVTSYKDYQRWFGGVFDKSCYMPNAVAGFFENGGKRLYVSRITGPGGTPASKDIGNGFTVTAVGPGAWGLRVWIRVREGSTTDKDNKKGFRLQLAYWTKPGAVFDPFAEPTRLPRPQITEDYDDLSIDQLSSDYFEKRMLDTATNESVSPLITLTGPIGATDNPSVADGDFLGTDGNEPPVPGVADFNPTDREQGLAALDLDPYRDVSLMYAPCPRKEPTEIAKAIFDHCEARKFCFSVIDAPAETPPGQLDPRVSNKWDTQFAAFYTPWIVTSDPLTGARVRVPPGGHMLGIYARTDAERGVFKAPANEVVRGALDVRFEINDGTQDVLNPRGVNAIRVFPTRGIRVWGARTLSSNGLWKYVSVRRLFIFIERSIYEGTQWVVFEPNDDKLWARVKDTIRLFLRSQWRGGALLGRTEDEAFFITCDRTTMSQDDILNGRLICEIGIAPVRPAEFVIFRIFQNTAEAQR
ncbi:MAG: phage tail sheath family protein [Acidobacteriota bacterium]|nr:phage tail sheath family protein [Acidobacteriota bacterium]